MNNKDISSIHNVSDWQSDFLSALAKEEIIFQLVGDFKVVLNSTLIITLISIKNASLPKNISQKEDADQSIEVKNIRLWEDVWLKSPKLVLSRIKSLLGLNIRIHGRKTKVVKIIKPVADLFLNENHLQGAVSSRYKLGLYLQDELIAVATFSALRKMNHTVNYTSVELIRFAVKMGYSVSGGLSKLIAAFYNDLHPNDMMTYADCDWSSGDAYLKIGFTHVSDLAPQHFSLDDHFNRRPIKSHQDQTMNFVSNSGSLKYILKF